MNPEGNEGKQFTCPKCLKVCESKRGLTRHIMAVHSDPGIVLSFPELCIISFNCNMTRVTTFYTLF